MSKLNESSKKKTSIAYNIKHSLVYNWKFTQKIFKLINNLSLRVKLLKVTKNHKVQLKKIKNKDSLNVVFFLINVDMWKLDSLYRSFNETKRYKPTIIICPFVTKGQKFMLDEITKSEEFCKKNDYNYILGYNKLSGESIDIKNIIKPDIVFFTNPNPLTSKEYLIKNYLDTLTCYVPYSFRIDRLYNYEYNNELVNLTWMNFYETHIHKKLAKKYALNKAKNVFVSGFPHLDSEEPQINDDTAWLPNSKYKKKIIWAPHWTIPNHQNSGLDWACFLDYYEFILELAKEFKNEVQFAMKPHPFLENTLANESLWGKSKTENYFKLWEELPNCQIVKGDYKSLFQQSDALIHDSGSFMTEYLVLNKPMAYTISDDNIENRFNEFGQLVLKCHQLIRNKIDFRNFVKAVINNEDSLINERVKIISNYHISSNNSIGDKIVNMITKQIQ